MVGKIAIEHIPLVEELRYRKVLRPISMMPRYLTDPDVLSRLELLRGTTVSVADLLGSARKRARD